MSKLAAYLRGHLVGEVVTRDDVREALSTDRGVLAIKPQMVIYPQSTNDIRKTLRFSWQLAEKGHKLPVTVRGGGTDSSGAAIGSGISLVMTAHMNKIFEYDAKQKLVRVQPGASAASLQSALALQGTSIPVLADAPLTSTVGGAIANFSAGRYAGKYGTIDRAIRQLEVVLANGDVMQTGRISKRELNKRKGLQTLEGDIYRGIDGIIEEYAETLDGLAANDATGYNTLADVKQKDGSFDLTPLFVGSQGTLGVISEMIMKAEFVSSSISVVALSFASAETARDSLDFIYNLKPTFADYFDAELFERSAEQGHSYDFYKAASEQAKPKAVVIVGFDDFSARYRGKVVKRISKRYTNDKEVHLTVAEKDEATDLLAALDVAQHSAHPDRKELTAPSIYSGFHIPTSQLENFVKALDDLAKRDHVSLPLSGHTMTNVYSVHPTFELHKVSDKQRLFKLLDDLTKLVYTHGGTMISEGGEGRLKTYAIYSQLDEKLVAMYEAVRKVCDPFDILNPGVKQPGDIRELASKLRSDSHGDPLARLSLS